MNLLLLICTQGLIGVLLSVGTLLTLPIYAQQPQSQEFLTWNQPQGDFSIEYPSDWTVEEKVNRFDETDVTFTSPLSAINGYVGVNYEDTALQEYNELIESGFDEAELILPKVEHMIGSIQILAAAEGVVFRR
jgi:hypothetical protein